MVELHLLSTSVLDATSRPGRFTPGNNVVSSETSVNCNHTIFNNPKDDGLHRHPVKTLKFNAVRVKLNFTITKTPQSIHFYAYYLKKQSAYTKCI